MAALSRDEIGLWRHAMRDVAPLRGRRRPPVRTVPAAEAPPPRHATPPAAPVPKPQPAVERPAPVPLPPLDRLAGLDRASADRLRRGRTPIEARLDLHGMTQAEAHRALSGFVARSRLAGKRCVLVITGHGRQSGGVLKQAVPRWLGEPTLRPHLLAIAPAQPQDGGSGAVYVLLRRVRETS